MRHNPRLLIALGALGALGFVVLRVVYRIVFGGASQGATTLPSFPAIRLTGPFSHIVLFGPLALEGLVAAALSALPFALVIFATAVVVSLWDPRNLIVLAPRLRVGGSIVLAAGLAIATFPVVLDAIARVKTSFALRGMKPGLRAFQPLLEKTLERSTAIARALESRGLRAKRSSSMDSGPQSPLSLSAWTILSRGVGPVSWSIAPGSAVVLSGATGSGKTTLLESCAGVWNLRGDALAKGTCSVGVPQGCVSYLPHDAASLFLTCRVVDDVALGLIARGVGGEEARKRATKELSRRGLSHLADRAPSELSSGEAVLCALAVVLATNPRVLLLDEPLSSLSGPSATRFMGELEKYRINSGATVILSDHPRSHHHISGYEEWTIGPEGLSEGRHQVTPVGVPRIPYRALEPDVVLSVTALSHSYTDTVVLNHIDLTITRGETCVIVGENGAGKSALLQAMASPLHETVWSAGHDVAELSPAKRVKHLALVPSTPSDLFVTASVAEELALADRIAGVEPGFTALTFCSILPALWIEDADDRLRATHPRDLSRGQQAALAIALQLSHKPGVLLVDEPMRGLDEAARHALAEVLACVVETGTAVVVASHHADHHDIAHDRVLVLSDGVLTAASTEVIV
jgi:energy-coupling factor transport system ATP-binding protein